MDMRIVQLFQRIVELRLDNPDEMIMIMSRSSDRRIRLASRMTSEGRSDESPVGSRHNKGGRRKREVFSDDPPKRVLTTLAATAGARHLDHLRRHVHADIEPIRRQGPENSGPQARST